MPMRHDDAMMWRRCMQRMASGWPVWAWRRHYEQEPHSCKTKHKARFAWARLD